SSNCCKRSHRSFGVKGRVLGSQIRFSEASSNGFHTDSCYYASSHRGPFRHKICARLVNDSNVLSTRGMVSHS
ncbi:hypothetical protein NPIL_147281, partial [Nephila pilipes]